MHSSRGRELRGALERDDRQIPALGVEVNADFKAGTWLATDTCQRQRTRRLVRPAHDGQNAGRDALTKGNTWPAGT